MTPNLEKLTGLTAAQDSATMAASVAIAQRRQAEANRPARRSEVIAKSIDEGMTRVGPWHFCVLTLKDGRQLPVCKVEPIEGGMSKAILDVWHIAESKNYLQLIADDSIQDVQWIPAYDAHGELVRIPERPLPPPPPVQKAELPQITAEVRIPTAKADPSPPQIEVHLPPPQVVVNVTPEVIAKMGPAVETVRVLRDPKTGLMTGSVRDVQPVQP